MDIVKRKLTAQVFCTFGTRDFSSAVSGIFGRMRRSVDLWPTPKYYAAREKKTSGTQGSVRKRIEDTCHMIRFIYGKLESSICTMTKLSFYFSSNVCYIHTNISTFILSLLNIWHRFPLLISWPVHRLLIS